MRRIAVHIRKANGWKIVILSIATGVLLVVYLNYRAHVADTRAKASAKTDTRLCHVLRSIIAASDPLNVGPGDAGYAYYAQHPAELRAAHRQTLHVLAQLNCEHLPTVKTAGG